jgi:uncharacterized membrane protein YhhN
VFILDLISLSPGWFDEIMHSAHATEKMQPNQTGGNQWLSILFFLVAGVSALWVVGSPGWFSTWQGFPNTALTTLFFLAGTAAANRAVPACYRWSVVAGLGCSALGDAFLMSAKDYFLAGLGSFLAAHICYLWAFTRDSRLAGHIVPFICWILFGIALMVCLWPGVNPSLRIPVVLYASALLTMAAQATSRAIRQPGSAVIFAAVGAGLFVISDSVLAYQRFMQPLTWGRIIVLGTYFAAQGGMALSVVFYLKIPVTSLR